MAIFQGHKYQASPLYKTQKKMFLNLFLIQFIKTHIKFEIFFDISIDFDTPFYGEQTFFYFYCFKRFYLTFHLIWLYSETNAYNQGFFIRKPYISDRICYVMPNAHNAFVYYSRGIFNCNKSQLCMKLCFQQCLFINAFKTKCNKSCILSGFINSKNKANHYCRFITKQKTCKIQLQTQMVLLKGIHYNVRRSFKFQQLNK